MNKFSHYRHIAEEKETLLLSPFAAFSKNHSRYAGSEDDHRLPYKRDVDRILHSKAYTRYSDKTQVVYLVDNDHITNRGLHVQLVSSFARGIAEILHLNLDLTEAIALGHDIGHPPFGHEGENYLSDLSIEYGNGPFMHPIQSCRLFKTIEPQNLGFAVYDGFLCHDGGIQSPLLNPILNKTWHDHEMEIKAKLENSKLNIMPTTLEGCLVKICDTVSYLARDLEDAITLGLISRDQIPESSLGNTNRSILTAMATDIISHSYEKNYIAFSENSFQALQTLREFNFKEIYTHPQLKVESHKIKNGYRLLFNYLLNDFDSKTEKSFLWLNYLKKKPENYTENSSPIQIVIDYISGMTNHFFIRTLENILIPQKIHLTPCVH
jgi:dGTPase